MSLIKAPPSHNKVVDALHAYNFALSDVVLVMQRIRTANMLSGGAWNCRLRLATSWARVATILVPHCDWPATPTQLQKSVGMRLHLQFRKGVLLNHLKVLFCDHQFTLPLPTTVHGYIEVLERGHSLCQAQSQLSKSNEP